MVTVDATLLLTSVFGLSCTPSEEGLSENVTLNGFSRVGDLTRFPGFVNTGGLTGLLGLTVGKVDTDISDLWPVSVPTLTVCVTAPVPDWTLLLRRPVVSVSGNDTALTTDGPCCDAAMVDTVLVAGVLALVIAETVAVGLSVVFPVDVSAAVNDGFGQLTLGAVVTDAAVVTVAVDAEGSEEVDAAEEYVGAEDELEYAVREDGLDGTAGLETLG